MKGLHKQAVYVVNREDADAMAAIREIFSNAKPGSVIPLSAAQYKALRRSIIVFVPPPPPEPMSRKEQIQSLTAKHRGSQA